MLLTVNAPTALRAAAEGLETNQDTAVLDFALNLDGTPDALNVVTEAFRQGIDHAIGSLRATADWIEGDNHD